MLAALAALHLAALSQVGQLPETSGARPGELAERGATGDAAWGAQPEPPPAHVSLLSAEPLRGGGAALAWAGWSQLGVLFAMGVTDLDDLGAFAEHDWATSENRLGVLYRRPLGKAGAFDAGARLSLAWYVDFGADYFYEENHSERGVELVPALSLSRRAGGGIFSLLAEAPMTVTTKYRTGFLFAPRASLAFEMPLYPQVTLGARIGAAYRAGSGDAPLGDGRTQLQFLLLAGYQLL